jgi:hypothetical protein
MSKSNKNELGFSAVEFVVIIVIIILIGAAGYFVYRHEHKSKTTTTTTTTSTNKSSSVTTNIYNNWKSYCDSGAKLCFKYPSSWSISDAASPPTGTVQTVINDPATVDAQYGDYPVTYGYPSSVSVANPLSSAASSSSTAISLSSTYGFYVTSISNTANNAASYKVVSGYYVGSTTNIPSVILIDTATANKLSLTANETATLQLNSFGISNSLEPNNVIILGAGPVSDSTYTTSQAKAWLSSTDGATALHVVQSIYSQ